MQLCEIICPDKVLVAHSMFPQHDSFLLKVTATHTPAIGNEKV